MKPKDFVIQLKVMFEQHISLIKSNSHLLELNLNLMKENDELKKSYWRLKNET